MPEDWDRSRSDDAIYQSDQAGSIYIFMRGGRFGNQAIDLRQLDGSGRPIVHEVSASKDNYLMITPCEYLNRPQSLATFIAQGFPCVPPFLESDRDQFRCSAPSETLRIVARNNCANMTLFSLEGTNSDGPASFYRYRELLTTSSDSAAMRKCIKIQNYLLSGADDGVCDRRRIEIVFRYDPEANFAL